MDERKIIKPEPEKDSEGNPIITLKYLQALCEYNNGYFTPHLNDVLYLNMKGFSKLENLEEYYNCKALYLDGNNLKTISGIGHMTDMVSLYLHDNMLESMIGIGTLTKLTNLTLANNMITRIEGIESCARLNKLDLSNNRLASLDSISALRHNAESLRILQLKNNSLPYSEDILTFFADSLKVAYLELKGNPFHRDCSSYRKTMVSRVDSLGFLDDKPVEVEERRLCKAWARGGREEESNERAKLVEERQQWMKSMVNHARASKDEALRIINNDYIEKEKEKQTRYKTEIEEVKRQLDSLRKEHIELNKLEAEGTKKKPQKDMDASDSDNEGSSVSSKYIETIEEMETRYNACLGDPNIPPLEKESLKQRLQSRKMNRQFGTEEETPIEANEFEQEMLEDRLEQLKDNLYASESHSEHLSSQVAPSDEEAYDNILGVYEELDEYGKVVKVTGTGKRAEVRRQQLVKDRAMEEKKELEKVLKHQKEKGSHGEEEKHEKGTLRWTTDMENSLENLLVSYKFNFNAATDAFNKFLEELQKKKGIVIKKQEWSDLAKKWSEMQKRKQTPVPDDTNSTVRNTEVPEDLDSVATWDELE